MCDVRSGGGKGICDAKGTPSTTSDDDTDVDTTFIPETRDNIITKDTNLDIRVTRNDRPGVDKSKKDSDMSEDSDSSSGSVVIDGERTPTRKRSGDPTTTSESTTNIQSLFEDINNHINDAQKIILSQTGNLTSLSLMCSSRII